MAGRSSLPAPPALTELLSQARHSLFLDFDGTLVKIAPRPGDIHVPENLLANLHNLHDRLDGCVALVSGRSLDDLESHLGPVDLPKAGSHGASRFLAGGERLGVEPEGLPTEIVEKLREYAALHGLLYETKRHGGALHFRGQDDKAEQAVSFARGVAEDHGLQLTSGKSVAELVRPGANKGAALQAFMEVEPFKGSVPIFIGDDVTDEDGMRAAIEFSGFGIAVGERESEAARYHLEDVEAVHNWLNL